MDLRPASQPASEPARVGQWSHGSDSQLPTIRAFLLATMGCPDFRRTRLAYKVKEGRFHYKYVKGENCRWFFLLLSHTQNFSIIIIIGSSHFIFLIQLVLTFLKPNGFPPNTLACFLTRPSKTEAFIGLRTCHFDDDGSGNYAVVIILHYWMSLEP